MARTAIIGFGNAGYHTAKTMREKGYTGEIHIYSDTNEGPANPMLTTYYIAGKIPFPSMFPYGDIEEIKTKYDLELNQDTTVTRISSKEKKIILSNGQSKYFDNIVISTGASAIRPSIPGLESKKVFYMRTEEDAISLNNRIQKGGIRSVVVVGASMVGIKLAEIFSDKDIKCTLLDLAPHIFPTAAFPSTAKLIEERIKARGIELKFNSSLDSVTETEQGLTAKLNDGSSLDCDILLLCIGTRANTSLVDEDIEVKRGIVVDTKMQTSAEDIYAAGDCCEGNNLLTGDTQIVGLWDNAAKQGQTAGANIAGVETIYKGNILHNITHFMGMDFIGLGDNRAVGQHHCLSDNDNYLEVVISDGKILCINLINHYIVSGIFKSYLIKCIDGEKEPLGDIQYARLIDEGISINFIKFLEGLE